eukprot:GFUD01018620.1.p1 GENE.GFUD01018620.1~~GFUD01018620.1.p1  ORF type:complete len:1348 (+),score=369.50 GFUD01018620.1:81-4124(+)
MILTHVGDYGKDRVDTYFVDVLIDIFMEKAERNVEKSEARKGRDKWQNFQHLLTKMVSPGPSSLRLALTSAGNMAKGVTAGVSAVVTFGTLGIAGGALATLLGVAGGAMAAWKISTKLKGQNQTKVITEALEDDSSEEDIVELLKRARVIITEVAHQLRFTFAHQLEHIQLPRDLRKVAAYAVALVLEEGLWNAGDIFDRNTILNKLVTYRPGTIGKLASMWDNKIKNQLGIRVKIAYFFCQPGFVIDNIYFLNPRKESYGYRQIILEKFMQMHNNEEIEKFRLNDTLDKPSEKMEKVIEPVERMKHSESNLSCSIFDKEHPTKQVFWFSGKSEDVKGFSCYLKAKKKEKRIVMLSQKVKHLGKGFFDGITLNQSTFISCNFSALKLVKTKFFHCTFVDCSFNNSSFNDCTLFQCSFQFCDMSGSCFIRGMLNVKDDTGTNFGESQFEKKSVEQEKIIETVKKILGQISSTTNSIQLESLTPSTEFNFPVANADSDSNIDWDRDIDAILSLYLSRISYMDPVSIIEKIKKEKCGPQQRDEIQNALCPFNSHPIVEIMGRNEEKTLGYVEANDSVGLRSYLQKNVVNINSLKHQEHDFFTNPEYNLLFHAIEKGFEEVCFILVEAGIDPKFQNNCGMTALQLAAGKGLENLGKVLIEHKATPDCMKMRVNAVNEIGESALHLAVTGKHTNFVEMLLAYPFINLDLQDKEEKNTALHTACLNGTSEMVKLLLKAKANNEIQNKRKKRPIDLCKHDEDKKIISENTQSMSRKLSPGWGPNEEEASKYITENNIDQLRKILQTTKLDFQSVRKYQSDESLLNKAVDERNLEAVELLVNAGADPDFLSEGHSSTPLLVSASEPSASDGKSIEDIALLLLSSGDLESRSRRAMQKDRMNRTPLHGSCKSGKIILTQELLKYPNIDVNAEMDILGYERDVGGWTPVHFACLAGNKDIIQLLEAQADMNKKGFNEEYGVVSPMELLDKFHPDLATLFNKEDANTEFEMLSKDSVHSDERNIASGMPMKASRSLLRFNSALVRPLVTRCYKSKNMRGEDLVQQLGEDDIITLEMFDRVKAKAEDVSSNTITPEDFVNWLEHFIQRHNEQIERGIHGIHIKSLDSSSHEDQIDVIPQSPPVMMFRKDSKAMSTYEKQAIQHIKNRNIEDLQRIISVVDVSGTSEESLLCKAVKADFYDAVVLLLENKADPTMESRLSGKTPLHVAAEHLETPDIARLLIEHNAYKKERGPRINWKDAEGWTPLHVACSKNNLELIKLLLEYESTEMSPRADIPEGWTPLHELAANDFRDAVDVLIAAGADTNAVAMFREEQGYGIGEVTPQMVAIKKSNTRIIHKLK